MGDFESCLVDENEAHKKGGVLERETAIFFVFFGGRNCENEIVFWKVLKLELQWKKKERI